MLTRKGTWRQVWRETKTFRVWTTKQSWRQKSKARPWFDFTNIFTCIFYAFSSQKHKSQSSCQYLFSLLGSAHVKAVRRTLMKLSPWFNFINMLTCIFYEHRSQKRKNSVKLSVSFYILGSVHAIYFYNTITARYFRECLQCLCMISLFPWAC